MNIHVYKTTQEMGEEAAKLIAAKLNEAIAEKGEARLLLSTGASQFEMMDALTKMPVDFTKVTMFHLDEYVGLPITHIASFRKYLTERFVNRVPLKEAVFVNGEGDVAANIDYISHRVKEAPIDVGVIGIGENGHIAFNDPAEADFNDPRWVKPVHLDEKCRQQQVNDGCFATIDDVPKTAMTVTIPGLLRAKAMFCVVPTRRKAEAVRRMLTEPVSEKCPASILRTKNAVKFYADSDAASLL